jgi:hypothetical protein
VLVRHIVEGPGLEAVGIFSVKELGGEHDVVHALVVVSRLLLDVVCGASNFIPAVALLLG